MATVALLVPSTDLHTLEGGATVSGRADVIDGDTLSIGTTRIRLFGIDAPENAQTCATARGGEWACGRAATMALRDLTAGRTVTCRGQGLDDYGRLLAVCATPRGELNEAMVHQGLAWAFVRYSDAYVQMEAVARAARKGVFAAQAIPPWDFRAQRWEGATQTADADR